MMTASGGVSWCCPSGRSSRARNATRTLKLSSGAERDGILRWMIEGARQYLASGNLALSPAILAEQRRYRSESDLLGEFLTDCAVADTTGRVMDKMLFDRWVVWCDGNGHKAGTKHTFTQRLAERGFPIRKSNGQRFYSGLRMAP
ncbi:hypothetical protein EAH79_14815 [Sphingomonas koreensis]|nr:hypothetical protein EAH79_14815 [Sphingomonas koreensis]